MATPKVLISNQWVAIGGQSIDTQSLINQAVDQSNAYTDQQIENVGSDVSNLQDYVDGSFKNGIVTSVEVKQIQSYLNNLASDKAKYDQDYSSLSSNSQLSAIDKNALEGAYNVYSIAYSNLVSYINQLLQLSSISSDQLNMVDSYFQSLNSSISTMEASIQFGINNIAQAKADNALGISNGSIEFTVGTYTYTVDVSDVSNQYDTLINDLTSLNSVVNSSFSDGILTSDEQTSIRSQLSSLSSDQDLASQQYLSIEGNSFISSTDKTNIQSAYSDYESSYNSLITDLNTVISGNSVTSQQINLIQSDTQNLLDDLDLLIQISIVVAKDNAISSVLSGSANDVLQTSESYTDDKMGNYVEETVYTQQIQALQQQVDNQVDTWYEAYDPTLDNAPANGWLTDDDRNDHVGDMFLNISTDQQDSGQAWRFILNGSTYEWQLITDNAIAAALQNSVNAQTLAEGKRRTFVNQPTPPYDLGDLWIVNASSNNPQVWNCISAENSSGSYSLSDWKQVGDVTSLNTAYDTAQVNGIESGVVITRLSTVETNVVTAQNTADGAQSTANSVQTIVGDLTITLSDGTVLVNGQKIQENSISNDQLDIGSITEDKMNWSTHLLF